MIEFIAFALVASNAIWGFFFYKIWQSARDERRELIIHIKRPDITQVPTAQFDEEHLQELIKPRDEVEYSAVGQVDPALNRDE